MRNNIQKDNIEIGEYYKVKDFEYGYRLVKVIEPISDKPGYYWVKYSDGGIYDFYCSELNKL